MVNVVALVVVLLMLIPVYFAQKLAGSDLGMSVPSEAAEP